MAKTAINKNISIGNASKYYKYWLDEAGPRNAHIQHTVCAVYEVYRIFIANVYYIVILFNIFIYCLGRNFVQCYV